MPALNFQARWADDVEAGRKTCTIRRERKRPIVPGDRLTLYTGQRTKHCRKLGEAICTSAERIVFDSTWHIHRSRGRLWAAERRKLAREEGFGTWQELVRWFSNRYGLPFVGVLIRWRLIGS